MITHGYVQVHKDTGQILSIRLPYGPTPEEGSIEQEIRKNITLTSDNIPNEDCLDFNYLCMSCVYDLDTDTFVVVGEPPNDYATYDFSASSWVWDATLVLNDIRDKRDALLAACDWTQMTDSPLTDLKKAEWVTYRQELRDFPATVTGNPVNKNDVTYPTPPS